MEVAGEWQLRVDGRARLDGNLVFSQVANLTYSPNFLTILIQPSRPVYNAGQTVRFRAILLTRDLKPYDEPVDVFVLDPNGRIMRRWPSIQTGHGVVTLFFDLPLYPLLGKWRIRVRALAQMEDKIFIVEQYFKHRFEVFVRLPQTVKLTDQYLEGVVVGNMSNWRHVYGNCTLQLQSAYHEKNTLPNDTEFSEVFTEFVYDFQGVLPFQFDISDIAGASASQDRDLSLRVVADVGDVYGWRIIRGWAIARVVHDTAIVKILGDQPLIFRPGMPITIHAFASYSDEHPFDEDELEDAKMTMTMSVTGAASKVESVEFYGEDLIEQRVVRAVFDVPNMTEALQIDVQFTSTSGLLAAATALGTKYHSPDDFYLQVETSNEDTSPGDFLTLHVRNNFRTDYINYIITGGNVALHSDRQAVLDPGLPTVTTFSVTASTEMAPIARVLVWAVTVEGQLVSHAIAIPVNPLGGHEVGIRWNDHKDHSGGSSELKMLGEKGSFFGVSALWEETNFMNAGHDLDKARVLNHMMGLGEDIRISKESTEVYLSVKKPSNHRIRDDYDYADIAKPHIRRAATRARDGSGSTVEFFATSLGGPDTASTFAFADLVLLTDTSVYYQQSRTTGMCKLLFVITEALRYLFGSFRLPSVSELSVDAAECDENLLSCLTGGCYVASGRCNGQYECPDRSDEAGCPIDIDPLRNFRIYRLSRIWRFYDPIHGDWAWRDVRKEGSEIQVFPIPKRPQTWVVNMFAVGKNKGLGLLQEKITFDSAGPFVLTLEAPKVARMWEQVGLRVCACNFDASMVPVMIVLPKSDLYKTVVVEENGKTEAYNPKKAEGEFQHIVWLNPGEYRDVHIPIVFTGMGEVTVTVYGTTQQQADSDSVTISVQAEGATIGKHTSRLLDLKNRGLVYDFLDISLDESPLIPYSLKRRYIYSTPSGHISITGDVVGPSFPEIPVNAECLLGMELMGAETEAYNFAANLWSLHYLRLTNQLPYGMTRKVLDAVAVSYAAIVRYQNPDGSFSMFPGDEAGVWLTSHVLKTLMIADFQDWENHLYVDRRILSNATAWLLDHQTEEGSFMETPHYHDPINPKIDPRSSVAWFRDTRYANITLTAHALLALVPVLPTLQSKLRVRANFATVSAVRYLERELPRLSDPYDIAVVAWALTTAGAGGSDLAFERLDLNKRTSDSRIYWSREPIGHNPIVYEDSQKPFVQPKDDQKWDAHAVEATAYALLVYVERESLGVIQENIVRFLAEMRELDGGLISTLHTLNFLEFNRGLILTLDSVVAMEALVAYSYRARIRDITDLKIRIELSSSPNSSLDLHLKNDGDLASIRSFDLDAIYGHINVIGHGSGQALVQLDYSYAVDQPDELDYPPVEAYDLEVTALYWGRNNSHINIKSCQRWTRQPEDGETSGLTITQIHLPSGYCVGQDDLIRLVESKEVPNLKWALRTDTTIKLFFSRLTSDWTCVDYRVERWYAVSNHSRYNTAMVYSHFQPERFNMTLFEVYPLYDLDICEVCGSYQCPYCPFYSDAPAPLPTPLMLLLLLLLFASLKNILWPLGFMPPLFTPPR
ncbi:Alpha-macroglobulin receptor-binding [Trinorchestia longiramus]|nr:Alpha-macroglobulin receptor-binding [Trinorchestia longiramus]